MLTKCLPYDSPQRSTPVGPPLQPMYLCELPSSQCRRRNWFGEGTVLSMVRQGLCLVPSKATPRSVEALVVIITLWLVRAESKIQELWNFELRLSQNCQLVDTELPVQAYGAHPNLRDGVSLPYDSPQRRRTPVPITSLELPMVRGGNSTVVGADRLL